MRNIYLIGMMGAGKTATGRELARLLSLAFTDIDDLIVDEVGRSINEIFKGEGEAFFRKAERDVLARVVSRSNQVVATGGGIVLDPMNRERIKATGTAIYLKTGLAVLWQRVQEKKDRPLLRTPEPRETLTELLRERSPFYEALADKSFLTDGKSPSAVAQEIFNTCFGKR